MSIATKTGDSGTTGLMYGHRVSKTHPRVETNGAIDELNAALGMARATAEHAFVKDNLFWIQKSLVDVMGEVIVDNADMARYLKDGYARVTPEMTKKLDAIVAEVESQGVSFKGWATPGATVNAAALDMARTICRRAERLLCALHERGEVPNGETVIYLNRLSDALWLMARWVESQASSVS
jgi:cob(I)alamin adenosyltransferase